MFLRRAMTSKKKMLSFAMTRLQLVKLSINTQLNSKHLEAYTKMDNLIKYGLSVSYAKADKPTSMDNSQSTFEMPPTMEESSVQSDKIFSNFVKRSTMSLVLLTL